MSEHETKPIEYIRDVPLGRIVMTSNAVAKLDYMEVTTALRRHQRGDWGEVDEHDRLVNEQAADQGDRLLSAYHDSKGTKFWIITEHDRSVTTVLLQEDY